MEDAVLFRMVDEVFGMADEFLDVFGDKAV